MKGSKEKDEMAHELRTPLTIIQTKQELLLENPNSKIIDTINFEGSTLSK